MEVRKNLLPVVYLKMATIMDRKRKLLNIYHDKKELSPLFHVRGKEASLLTNATTVLNLPLFYVIYANLFKGHTHLSNTYV